jgi:hypothetical protein
MKRFLWRFWTRLDLPLHALPKPPVSLEQFQQMLEYSRLRNLCGSSRHSAGHTWIGSAIKTENAERSFVRLVDTEFGMGRKLVVVYPSVTWSYSPNHLGIYLVNGVMEFRANNDGVGPREAMPLATDPDDLAEIRRCFDFWYSEFGLPGTLKPSGNSPKRFEPTGDHLYDLSLYLQHGSVTAFQELFEDSGPIIWVHWGEEDDNIVRMASEILALDNLTARFDDENGDLLISFRGIEHCVRYPKGGVADRDIIIIALNDLLQPDYEIRVCNASHGSDTLAFIALSASDWTDVEQVYPEACNKYFHVIMGESVIFGRFG